MSDEFAEFDTPPEDILAVLNAGEQVTFGAPSRFVVTRCTWPTYDPTTASVGAPKEDR